MLPRKFFLPVLAAVWLVQSCGNGSASTDPVAQAKETNENNKTVKEDDSEFMTKAASGGMMEVQLGQMAQEKAKDQRVKDFGAMMVRDHTKANDELKALASNKNIALPTALGEEHQKHVDHLSKTAGADFDKAYISMMVDDHKEDISDFDKASGDAKDADIKAFAAKTLPVLRTHLDAAKAINDKQ